jgi:hypothetical protein
MGRAEGCSWPIGGYLPRRVGTAEPDKPNGHRGQIAPAQRPTEPSHRPARQVADYVRDRHQVTAPTTMLLPHKIGDFIQADIGT